MLHGTRMPNRFAGRVCAILALAVGVSAPTACGPEAAEDEAVGIETERFVATYVDLRMATLRAGVDQLPLHRRDSILDAHGVTQEDLLEYVEINGRNAQFMQAVWDTIEDRIDRQRVPALGLDSASTPEVDTMGASNGGS